VRALAYAIGVVWKNPLVNVRGDDENPK